MLSVELLPVVAGGLLLEEVDDLDPAPVRVRRHHRNVVQLQLLKRHEREPHEEHTVKRKQRQATSAGVGRERLPHALAAEVRIACASAPSSATAHAPCPR